MEDSDYMLALALQADSEDVYEQKRSSTKTTTGNFGSSSLHRPLSVVDKSWELLDPNPDVCALFLEFNDQYFWGRLAGVEVKWSPRMTLCAGVCSYEGHGGLCSIRLSVPLLKLRPRKDLVETLLHEMIHAFLFVADNDREREEHGPSFKKHMDRINKASGANITIYHDFQDEVDNYRRHWWRCDGPCRHRAPYFGFVKRSMNRAPSSHDPWWDDHIRSCGGTYIKVKEPEGFGQKKKERAEKKDSQWQKALQNLPCQSGDIRKYFGSTTSGTDQQKNYFSTKRNPSGMSPPNTSPRENAVIEFQRSISETPSNVPLQPTTTGYVLGKGPVGLNWLSSARQIWNSTKAIVLKSNNSNTSFTNLIPVPSGQQIESDAMSSESSLCSNSFHVSSCEEDSWPTPESYYKRKIYYEDTGQKRKRFDETQSDDENDETLPVLPVARKQMKFSPSASQSLAVQSSTSTIFTKTKWKNAESAADEGLSANRNNGKVTNYTSVEAFDSSSCELLTASSQHVAYPEAMAEMSVLESVNQDTSSVICPVCERQVPGDCINTHLDQCLSLS